MYRSADPAGPAELDDPSTEPTGLIPAPGTDTVLAAEEVDTVLAAEEADTVLAAEEADTVVVHVALRPRRGSARRCLAGLAALAAAHPDVAVSVTGLGKDERAVRVTVGVELGPRAGVARFSPQAQAAYAFVSDLFTTLYDHMPVYSAEPGPAERAAAAGLMASLGVGSTATATAATAAVAVPPVVPAGDAVPAPQHVLA
ncbi:hypothetical protein [Trujillonella humicola]|uniref:hypothetical protein n=1 Tax=Trujillonella humicola TaxID=3383699 RepID=UPI00390648EC